MTIQAYARLFGWILLVIGIGGLLLGNSILGVINSDTPEDWIHILSGLVLLGSVAWRSFAALRTSFIVLGVMYVLVGIYGFIDPSLQGVLPTGYGIVDNIIHLAVGGFFVWLGFGQTRSRF